MNEKQLHALDIPKRKLLMSLGIFYPSQVGGPGNTLYWIGKALVQKNISVKAIVSDKGIAADFAPRDQWYNLDGIQIKYCSTKTSVYSIKLFWKTFAQVKQSDVVMLSSLFYKPNFFVGLMALLYGKKIIWSPRGELFVPRGRIKRGYLKLIKYFFGQRIIFHATSTEEEEAVYKHMGINTNCVQIPNYMELPYKITSPCESKYLLYVGRIMPIKALEKLIEGVALSKLFKSEGYKLYLAGKNEGEYYHKLLELVKAKSLTDKVIFKGMIEGLEKEHLYAGAKATILVSQSENFGNVIIESLAQGTPAITSLGTPWQILNKSQAGFWIENSPKVIAQTIDELLAMTKDEYQLMRDRAYKLCSEQFDIDSNINKWIEVIK